MSTNLVDWTLHGHLLGVQTNTKGDSIQMGNYHYCSNWAPEIRPSVERGGYILSFTSSRYEVAQRPCPPYDEGSGTFVAYSESPFGPFNTATSHPQPTGASTDPEVCPVAIHDSLPFTHVKDTHDCGSFFCNNTQRLDSDLFNDPEREESWFAYSWYSNSEPLTPFDHGELGEHVSLVRVNHSEPMLVPCDPNQATKVWVQSPHDDDTIKSLAAYCERCGEQLSFTKGRMNETMERDGVVWGVVEASMLFRRGNYVYQLMSHSAWDSAYYSVMFAAAPSAAELGMGSPTRIVGRFLVPSKDQSFGHGSAVLGPDNEHWFVPTHTRHCIECSKTAAAAEGGHLQAQVSPSLSRSRSLPRSRSLVIGLVSLLVQVLCAPPSGPHRVQLTHSQLCPQHLHLAAGVRGSWRRTWRCVDQADLPRRNAHCRHLRSSAGG